MSTGGITLHTIIASLVKVALICCNDNVTVNIALNSNVTILML